MRPGGMGMSLSTDRAVTVLPQPELADHAERLTAVDGEINAIDCPHHAVVGDELRLQPPNFEQPLAGDRNHDGYITFRGSKVSRKPSPMKLIVSTVIKIMTPGNSAQCGATSR